MREEGGGRLQQVELQLVTIIKCGISADVQSYECFQLLGSLLVGYVHSAPFPGSGVWIVDCGGLGTMLVRVNLRSITAVIEGGWGALCVSSHVVRGHCLSRASVL